jgi:hypothetical protein
MTPKPNKSEPIKTILIISLGMIVVYFYTQIKLTLVISLVIGILGLSSAFLAKKIDFLWMKLSWLLSLIVPNILLSCVFYLFLTPIAFLSKLFGEKNPLTLKNKETSLFKDHKKVFDKSSFEKPW